jgi:predicted MFS family arabinose efflux permease
MSEDQKMSPLEWRATSSLAAVSSVRMLGLFLILPVFSLYAEGLPENPSHTLIGVALGVYGLTQAALQIPFGWASDRWGRKRVICVGLLVFAAGSFVAAASSNIYFIILGRALQGAGAISAAVVATAADLTTDSNRTKAMAVIGVSIGVAFAVSIVIGPLLGASIGVPGIFALTGFLALCAIAITRFVVPEPGGGMADEANTGRFFPVLRDRELFKLNYGSFALHAALMALFLVVPLSLRDAGLKPDAHWQVYLPVIVMSFVGMLPALLYGDRKGKTKTVFALAIAGLLAGEVLLAKNNGSVLGLSFSLLVFFTAFNLLEALLPSLVTRISPPAAKGTAIGVYSSIQFLGAFAGAAIGGLILQHHGADAVFMFGGLLIALWGLLAITMRAPEVRTVWQT